MSTVAELLDGTKALLLDFDGPVCHLFAGHPAPVVGAEIRNFLSTKDVELPPSLESGKDPLKTLRWVGSNHSDLMVAVEEILCSGELLAAQKATPTRHARTVIIAAVESGRPIAIVSNNSAQAITAYLTEQNLDQYIATVVGRPYGRPELMKPDPKPVIQAAMSLSVPSSSCAFVGDTIADMEAAQKAGTRSIGYAKSPIRVPGLIEAGAGAVIHSMELLASALKDSPSS